MPDDWGGTGLIPYPVGPTGPGAPGKGLFALAPMVALLLTIEAVALLVFTDLSGLAETYEKSIIVP